MDRGVLIWPLLCGTRAGPQTRLSKSLKLAVRSKPGKLAYPQVDGGLGAGWALLSGADHFSSDSIDHAWRMIRHCFISAIMVTTNRFIHFHSAAEIASRLPARSVGERYVFVIVTARSCSSWHNPQLCVGR
jgi:hypothetical protein